MNESYRVHCWTVLKMYCILRTQILAPTGDEHNVAMKEVTLDKTVAWLEQRVPINELWPVLKSDATLATYSRQEELLDYLTNSEILQNNPYYVKTFFKKYIDYIEHLGEEMLEQLYEVYCDVLLPARELDVLKKDKITYYIGGFDQLDPKFSLQISETPKLISGINTTGLRTWEAAIYLANYLNAKRLNWQDHTVLELGGGTGLLSIALKNQDLKQIIITDGSASLIDNLSETLHLNYSTSSTPIKCQQLLWGTTNSSQDDYIQEPPSDVDVLVGADITYDASVVDSLASTIADFFGTGTKVAIIAATVRNGDTIEEWEKTLNKWFPEAWNVIDRCLEPANIDSLTWFRQNTPEIRVYQIDNLTQ